MTVRQQGWRWRAVRNMIFTANFVCHRVVDTQERIGKRHACDGRGYAYIARFRIGRTMFVGAFEVLEHELNGLQGEAVCKVVRQYGKRMLLRRGSVRPDRYRRLRHCRYGHGKRRIDNRNGRCQRVVGNRIFLIAVANDGKRRDFGAYSRRGRDADNRLCGPIQGSGTRVCGCP